MADSVIHGDFAKYHLDFRILKAIKDIGWISPTDIQDESLSLALKGSHLLIRSRTGSGKTAIYLISIIEKLIESKFKGLKAIVFAPSSELCQQIAESLRCLITYIPKVKYYVTVSDTPGPGIFDDYHVIIGTPNKCLHLLTKYDKKEMFKIVVFDEADLLFTHGHRDSLNDIGKLLPTRMQVFVLSATLNEDVEKLCVVHLVNPKRIIVSDEPFPDSSQLSQYVIKYEDSEKYLILYSLLVLGGIKGKTLIFCNTINHAYKLHLFLKFLAIKTLVLNPELPVNSRLKTVKQFTKSKVCTLISTDLDDKPGSESVSRGMDFTNVDNVINFDFPESITSYVHRIGRTARVDAVGLSLSFCNHNNADLKSLEKFVETNSNSKLLPFKFKTDISEGFRYRVEDALRSTTKSAIIDARREEIKEEIYNSQKLQERFKNKPREKMVLKAQKPRKKIQSYEYMKKLPEYLIPETMKNSIKCEMDKTGYFNIDHKKAFLQKKFGRNGQCDPMRRSKRKREF